MIALIGAILFLIPARWNPRMVMRIFTTSESSIEMGAAYLMVAALPSPCTAVTNTYVAMLRSVNRVKEPVIISCVAILTNITFNYIFIFGHFGAPALGVVGAALATLIARILEMTLILLTVYVGKTPLACHVRELFGYSSLPEHLLRSSAMSLCGDWEQLFIPWPMAVWGMRQWRPSPLQPRSRIWRSCYSRDSARQQQSYWGMSWEPEN